MLLGCIFDKSITGFPSEYGTPRKIEKGIQLPPCLHILPSGRRGKMEIDHFAFSPADQLSCINPAVTDRK